MQTKNRNVHTALMSANAGVAWGVAVQEACIYSLENCVNVVLEFNGKRYKILQQDLIACANEIQEGKS